MFRLFIIIIIINSSLCFAENYDLSIVSKLDNNNLIINDLNNLKELNNGTYKLKALIKLKENFFLKENKKRIKFSTKNEDQGWDFSNKYYLWFPSKKKKTIEFILDVNEEDIFKYEELHINYNNFNVSNPINLKYEINLLNNRKIKKIVSKNRNKEIIEIKFPKKIYKKNLFYLLKRSLNMDYLPLWNYKQSGSDSFFSRRFDLEIKGIEAIDFYLGNAPIYGINLRVEYDKGKNYDNIVLFNDLKKNILQIKDKKYLRLFLADYFEKRKIKSKKIKLKEIIIFSKGSFSSNYNQFSKIVMHNNLFYSNGIIKINLREILNDYKIKTRFLNIKLKIDVFDENNIGGFNFKYISFVNYKKKILPVYFEKYKNFLSRLGGPFYKFNNDYEAILIDDYLPFILNLDSKDKEEIRFIKFKKRKNREFFLRTNTKILSNSRLFIGIKDNKNIDVHLKIKTINNDIYNLYLAPNKAIKLNDYVKLNAVINEITILNYNRFSLTEIALFRIEKMQYNKIMNLPIPLLSNLILVPKKIYAKNYNITECKGKLNIFSNRKVLEPIKFETEVNEKIHWIKNIQIYSNLLPNLNKNDNNCLLKLIFITSKRSFEKIICSQFNKMRSISLYEIIKDIDQDEILRNIRWELLINKKDNSFFMYEISINLNKFKLMSVKENLINKPIINFNGRDIYPKFTDIDNWNPINGELLLDLTNLKYEKSQNDNIKVINNEYYDLKKIVFEKNNMMKTTEIISSNKNDININFSNQETDNSTKIEYSYYWILEVLIIIIWYFLFSWKRNPLIKILKDNKFYSGNSNHMILGCILMLVISMILEFLKIDVFSEKFAVIAFYMLIIGILLEFFKIYRIEKK